MGSSPIKTQDRDQLLECAQARRIRIRTNERCRIKTSNNDRIGANERYRIRDSNKDGIVANERYMNLSS